MNSHPTNNRCNGVFDCSKRCALLACLGLWAMAGLLGCAQKNESQEDDSAEGYGLIGVILEVDEAAGTLKVAHEEIPDFMPAMTMDFRAGPGDLKLAKPQMRIKARLVRDADGGFRLIKIWPIDEDTAAEMRRVNERLAEQAGELSSGYYYGEGDALPDFALLNQRGLAITPADLRGKPFMLNFIFTRCTDAQMCPLSTSKMAQLQKLAAAKGISDQIQFVSISLDPVFDTPGVLRSYADGYGIDSSNFHFLTGPKEAVRLMLKSLGVTLIESGEGLTHSLATVLVDKNGTIALRSDKSAWEPEAFLAAIEKLP